MSDFLTPERKQYYLTELDKCKKCGHPDWVLDNRMEDVLNTINVNPKVQTLISKRPKKLKTDNTSYLQLTCTEDVANQLKELITEIVAYLRKYNNTCSFVVHFDPASEPSAMNEPVTDERLKSLDIVSKVEKYTAINRTFLMFTSFSMKQHDDFWSQMLRFANLQ